MKIIKRNGAEMDFDSKKIAIAITKANLAAEESERKMKAAREAMKASIPDTYVVQEGDTLYKIALRFYGRTSAWKMIREANKESITTDGRVRTGQTLKLPK